MTIPDSNIRRPLRPVNREGYPHNREEQTVDGIRMVVGRVIPVGRDPNESWISLAEGHGLRPWEIIWANFETDVPEEVNWYLRHYVGCHRLGPRGRNFRFYGADPGVLLMPFGAAVTAMVASREHERRARQAPDLLNRRWPDRKTDIMQGEVLVQQMLRQAFGQAVRFARNKQAFDVRAELSKLVVSKAEPSVEGLLGAGPEDLKLAKLPKLFFLWKELAMSIGKPFAEMGEYPQEIRRQRQDIYAGFAAGLAGNLFPACSVTLAGQSLSFVALFDQGQAHARSLVPLDRYRLALALADRSRRRGMAGFAPLDQTPNLLRSRLTESGLRRLIENEFSSARYFFRNQ